MSWPCQNMNLLKTLFLWIFLYSSVFHNYVICRISNERKCVDAKCSLPISYARTLIRYNADDARLLSFPPNAEATIFSKEAGDNPTLWGAEEDICKECVSENFLRSLNLFLGLSNSGINGRRGYVPKELLRERKVLVKTSDLKYTVPTELVKAAIHNVSDSTSEPDLTKTPELPAANSKGIFSMISGVSADSVPPNSPDIKPQSTKKIQVFDGTTIYQDSGNYNSDTPSEEVYTSETNFDPPHSQEIKSIKNEALTESTDKTVPLDVPPDETLGNDGPVLSTETKTSGDAGLNLLDNTGNIHTGNTGDILSDKVMAKDNDVTSSEEIKVTSNTEQDLPDNKENIQSITGYDESKGPTSEPGLLNTLVNSISDFMSSGAGPSEEENEDYQDEYEESSLDDNNQQVEDIKNETPKSEAISLSDEVKNMNKLYENMSEKETDEKLSLSNLENVSEALNMGQILKKENFSNLNVDTTKLQSKQIDQDVFVPISPNSVVEDEDKINVSNEKPTVINETSSEETLSSVEHKSNDLSIVVADSIPIKTHQSQNVEEKVLENEKDHKQPQVLTINDRINYLQKNVISQHTDNVFKNNPNIDNEEKPISDLNKTNILSELNIELQTKNKQDISNEAVKQDSVDQSVEKSIVPKDNLTKPVEQSTMQSPKDTIVEPVEQSTMQSPEDNITEPVETSIIQSPEDNMTEPVEQSTITSPEDNITKPVEHSIIQSSEFEQPTSQKFPFDRINLQNENIQETVEASINISKELESSSVDTSKKTEYEATPAPDISTLLDTSSQSKQPFTEKSNFATIEESQSVIKAIHKDNEQISVISESSDSIITHEEEPILSEQLGTVSEEIHKDIIEEPIELPLQEISPTVDSAVDYNFVKVEAEDFSTVKVVDEYSRSHDDISLLKTAETVSENEKVVEDIVTDATIDDASVEMFSFLNPVFDLFRTTVTFKDSTNEIASSKRPIESQSVDSSGILNIKDESCLAEGVGEEPCDAVKGVPISKDVSWQDSLYSADITETLGLLNKIPLETTIWLIVTAVVVLIFSLGHYYIEAHRRDGPLVAAINKLEREVLILKKEACIMEDRLQTNQEQLDAWNTNSSENDALIVELKQELEETKAAKLELEEQLTVLEREVETVTESGLEMHRLLEESLSSQDGSQVLLSTVQSLREKLEHQENEIVGLSQSLSHKNIEVEELQEKLAQSAEVAQGLEDRIIAVTRAKEEDALQLKDNQMKLMAKLEEVMETKALDETRVSAEMSKLRLTIEELQKILAEKESELEAVKEVVKQLRSTDSNDKMDALFDVVGMTARLKEAVAERDELREKFHEEEGARKLLEGHVQKITQEVRELKNSFETAEKEKIEALTKLQVLSNYFKEKESQLQKELGMQESMWLQKQSDDHTIYEQMRSLREENEKYKVLNGDTTTPAVVAPPQPVPKLSEAKTKNKKKSNPKISLLRQSQGLQNESLKKEIVEQESSFKIQLANVEQKSHENWVASRQADRRLKEVQQEAAQLRNRLTSNSANYSLDDSKQNISESNGDPSSPPPSLMFPSTASPPFMMYPMPPPGDFVPPPPLVGSPYPSDSRPPPLGRISSPPLDHRFSPPPPLPYPPYDYPPYGHHSPSPPPPLPPHTHHRTVHKPQPRDLNREQKDHVMSNYSPESEKTKRRNKR